MFLNFFYDLREAGVPVSVKEYVGFLDAMEARVIEADVDEFYYLSRAVLVKDERHFDSFDRAFAHFFQGAEKRFTQALKDIPEEWLKDALERIFSKEELAELKAMESWEDILETFVKRLEEQQEAHHGGGKWIGTGGTSPFGSGGANPAGIRVGSEGGRRGQAVKVWEQRRYKALSGDEALHTRNIKMALKRLRLFAREGLADELDLVGTIRMAAKNGALLDVEMRPERKNRVKILLFFDIGGSMAPYVKRCEQLFSSARAEFKHLETFFFHNCLYEQVWKEEHRWEGRLNTLDILHKYNGDYRVIVVGDAAMSPYELLQAGGSVDHFNPEPGVIWLKRLRESFPHSVWINPEPRDSWAAVESTHIIQQIFENRMFPLTLAGLGGAMKTLRRRNAQSLNPNQ